MKATDSEIAEVAKEWFRYACDREGGRKQREERKKAREAQERVNQGRGQSEEREGQIDN